jgi:hypothetical protein
MYYGCLRSVVALNDADGGVALLNLRTGQWLYGVPGLGLVWDELARGLELRAALDAASERGLPSAARLEIELAVPELAQLRLLTTRPRPPGRLVRSMKASGPSPSRRLSVTETDVDPSMRYRLAAAIGFTTAIILQYVPLRLRLWLLHLSCRLRPQYPTLAATRVLVATVRQVARHHRGWRNCLEINIGAFIAGALLGVAPALCIGVRMVPFEQHLWLEADETAIDDEPQDGDYTAMIRIHSPGHGHELPDLGIIR